MKVLHIINSLETGGAEKLIVETLPLYAEQGMTADLLLLNGTKHPFLQELAGKKCCQIFMLGTSSVYHPKNIFGIIPYLKKYDIVHVHLFPAQYYAVMAKIISGAKTKLVFTEHNGTNRRLNNFWFSLIDKQIYKFYTRTICITKEIKNILVSHSGLPEKRFPLIRNGVNLNKIITAVAHSREALHLSISSEDTILIQIAAFREQKEQKTLIKAMMLLPADFKLLLVGDGALKEDHEKLVVDLGMQRRVFFLGVRMDIPQLLKTADIVVLSSKYEGLSLSSIEGMACEKPFVASDVPGLTEIVQDAGILFPLGDQKKLAEELLRLATDQDYYEKIALQCMLRSKDFDITKMVDQHVVLYQELSSTI